MGQHRDKLLKNMTELARALGRPCVFVKRMKWAGFPHAGRRFDSNVGIAMAKGNIRISGKRTI